MRITAIALDSSHGWPALRTETLAPGLNVVHGPEGSGKTMLADLAAHALFGKRLPASSVLGPARAAGGELVVDSGDRGYRLRRHFDSEGQAKLTVAALDASAVDSDTVRHLLGGLPPVLAAPVFVPRFRLESVEQLVSEDFLQRSLSSGERELGAPPLKAQLVARRDALARELEMHIAGERLESHTLDERWHQLDRLVKEADRSVVELRERLRGIVSATAEADTRLRYLELEATLGQQSHDCDPTDRELQITELDERIAQWRLMLSKLQQREAAVRGELAQVQSEDEAPEVALADQRVWLAMARRWSADLQGEVARLAHATESQTCVCHDAHPRLQPLVEAILGQLGALESLVAQHERAVHAVHLGEEADDLTRSQAALQGQLERLLERRQAAIRSSKPGRRMFSAQQPDQADSRWRDMHHLDQRRWKLQKEQAEVLDELAKLEPRLRDLQTERDTVDRQRAGMLSAQSIDALRGQLAAVQRQLECATHAPLESGGVAPDHVFAEASDFLAQLTDGGLVGIFRSRQDDVLRVVNRDGRQMSLAALSNGQSRQLQLSMCLTLAAVWRRRGLRLPLVLDEPFADSSAAETAALAAVLDDVGRRGQQVVVFTGRQTAVERCSNLGVATQSMRHLQLVASADDILIDRASTDCFAPLPSPANGKTSPRVHKASGSAGKSNGRRRKVKRKRTES